MSITGRFWVSTEAQVARATSQIGSGPALDEVRALLQRAGVKEPAKPR